MSWGRRKRWHFWCVMDEREAVSLTVADLDYLSFGASQIVPLGGGKIRRKLRVRPGGLRLPDRPATGRVDVGPFRIDEDARGARIVAPDFDIRIERPAGWDGLDVHSRLGPYSFKQPRLPAHGIVRGRTIDGFACLDYGRGIWPLRSEWRWASASGRLADGRTIAFNLGAIWSDEENALFVDGSVTRLGPVRFDDIVRITGDGVDLRLDTRARVKLPISEQHLGVWSGRVGEISFDGVYGWSEAFRTLW